MHDHASPNSAALLVSGIGGLAISFYDAHQPACSGEGWPIGPSGRIPDPVGMICPGLISSYPCGVARPGEALAEIPLETRRFRDLGCYLLEPMIERVRVAEQHAGELLGGRTVWVVKSTALGGGVAQSGVDEGLRADDRACPRGPAGRR